MNDGGQTAGYSHHYIAGVYKGPRAVRWSATGSVTELASLGTDGSSVTLTNAYSINNAGQTVGSAQKYVNGAFRGSRGVLWDVAGNASELSPLGTDGALTMTNASWINSHGQIAGSALNYQNGGSGAEHAVYWRSDGVVVDLNTLILPSSNWILKSANSITDNGWIAGLGLFDPDGPLGPLSAYQRGFVLNLGSAAVTPEPQMLVLSASAGLMLLARQRRK
jgi:hypothetical protein